ncbi:translation initiation factor IF-2 [Streptomyces cinnamoneus]|uniref:translation initiation factor IF-2 n=1 Tax=Streptomyces cinnamoneus TaxID=53446 RepID=UPI000CEE4463|nr:translation initiation factor IF-2 [Streptomyces cinnamoneus]PPT14403.1 translation initiation factor IF-2 [Streptomyces cinnamoneus]
MTAVPLSAPGRGGAETRQRPRPGLRGLLWLALRQHRAMAWTALGALVALGLTLVWLRFALVSFTAGHHLQHGCDLLAECHPGDEVVSAYQPYADAMHYIGRCVAYLPLVVGAFVAGPVIARELESGTYKLAWTQSLSPTRWFAVKLATVTVAVLAGVSLLSALYTWAWRAEPVGLERGGAWFRAFDVIGPVPVGQALLAVAVGALTGLLVRRTVAAMGGAIAAHLLLTAPLQQLREKLVDPVTELSSRQPGLIGTDGRWILGRGLVDQSGGRVPEPDCGIGVSPEDCVARHGATGWYVDYHPASHLWPLQWAEAGVHLGAAAAVAAAAVWVVRRRHP